MRQRLAVARAFMHTPEVLLLDEPFTALDDRAIAVLQSLLAEAHAAGRTIILSTHQLREALEVATHGSADSSGASWRLAASAPNRWSTILVGCIRRMERTEACPHPCGRTYTIAAKDLRSEMRTEEAFNASFAFSLVILVLFSYRVRSLV